MHVLAAPPLPAVRRRVAAADGRERRRVRVRHTHPASMPGLRPPPAESPMNRAAPPGPAAVRGGGVTGGGRAVRLAIGEIRNPSPISPMFPPGRGPFLGFFAALAPSSPPGPVVLFWGVVFAACGRYHGSAWVGLAHPGGAFGRNGPVCYTENRIKPGDKWPRLPNLLAPKGLLNKDSEN